MEAQLGFEAEPDMLAGGVSLEPRVGGWPAVCLRLCCVQVYVM